jgi:hypothetical protein
MICRAEQAPLKSASYLPGMSADPIVVAILIFFGSLAGLVLSIVPRLAGRFGPLSAGVSRAVNGAYVGVYVAFGGWVHYWRGASYPQDHATYMRALAADECDCFAPIDGRHGWLLFWIVAGFVAYALRPGSSHRVFVRRGIGAELLVLGAGVIWLVDKTGQSEEILWGLVIAGAFIAAGMTVILRATAPRTRRA